MIEIIQCQFHGLCSSTEKVYRPYIISNVDYASPSRFIRSYAQIFSPQSAWELWKTGSSNCDFCRVEIIILPVFFKVMLMKFESGRFASQSRTKIKPFFLGKNAIEKLQRWHQKTDHYSLYNPHGSSKKSITLLITHTVNCERQS